MKNALKILFAWVAASSTPAFAAKMEVIYDQSKLVSLQGVYERLQTFCTSPSDGCNIDAYQILEKKKDEKIENTIKQIYYKKGSIADMSVERVYKYGNTIFNEFEKFFEIGKLMVECAFEDAKEDLRQDLYRNKNILVFAGDVDAECLLHDRYIAFVDTMNDQILIFSVGYTE